MLSKKEILEYYLSQGETLVEINPSVKGLIIPETFIKKGRTRVSLNPNDTVLNDDNLETKLFFEEETHEVKIPYTSIYVAVLAWDEFYGYAISFMDCFPEKIRNFFSEEDYETLHSQYEFILDKILNKIPLEKEDSFMDRKQILLDHLAIAKTTIVLDSTTVGVKLPKQLMGKDNVRLNLSNHFSMPMQFRDDKVVATLSFQGQPFECHIPYEAIYALFIAGSSPEDAVVFDESVPSSTKRMISLYESSNLDAMKFMSELETLLDRDDVIMGNLEGTDKPQ